MGRGMEAAAMIMTGAAGTMTGRKCLLGLSRTYICGTKSSLLSRNNRSRASEHARPLVQSPEEQDPSLSIIECGLLTVTDEQAGILQHVEDSSHVPLQDEIIDAAIISEIIQDPEHS